MVLNKNIHEFDHLESKQNVLQKAYCWLVDKSKERQRLLQELDYWKIKANWYEKRYKNLLRSVKDEKKEKFQRNQH